MSAVCMWDFFFSSSPRAYACLCAHIKSHPECPCDWSGATEGGGGAFDLTVVCTLCGGAAARVSAFSSDGYKCELYLTKSRTHILIPTCEIRPAAAYKKLGILYISLLSFLHDPSFRDYTYLCSLYISL